MCDGEAAIVIEHLRANVDELEAANATLTAELEMLKAPITGGPARSEPLRDRIRYWEDQTARHMPKLTDEESDGISCALADARRRIDTLEAKADKAVAVSAALDATLEGMELVTPSPYHTGTWQACIQEVRKAFAALTVKP